MCDKKNKVLFTDTECLVLSPDFKLHDENQVLLRVPRQNNMYSFHLENIVPTRGLACLIAKAIVDESNKWHRRLGHVNFKNLNKLVKGNLVRGLPSKIFQNDHTCVACQKGKQHKASCKAKLVSSISQPLQLLHMDLFGPTSVRSINQKTYCLVITDDFGRCDNGTEFKNRDIIELCGSKEIKREYYNARTPQQNRVDERKNKTLIEATRTMLVDLFLPNTFWPEVVSTACYVLNRVLVIKPQNKTPYELITGRGPNWLFHLDYLTDSMNYQPMRSENQANKTASPEKANHSAELNTVSTPLSTANPSNVFNIGGPSYPNLTYYAAQYDSQIHALEDIYVNSNDGIFTNAYYDDEGAVADFTNSNPSVKMKPHSELFGAFASYMGFVVNQMDAKSTFLYDTIDEELPEPDPLLVYNVLDDLPDITRLQSRCLFRFQDKHNVVSGKSKEFRTLRYLSLVVPLKKVGDEAVHKELGDKMERAATTASSLEAEQDIATASTNVHGDVKLNPIIDGQAKTVTEASLRRHLKLEDDGGITSLPNTEIFELLALIGAPLTSPPPILKITPTVEEPAPMPHESPLQSVHSLGCDDGSVSLIELMALVIQLTNKVGSLENELMNTKKVYGSTITKLVNRVKKLEKQVKTGTTRRGTKIVLSKDEAVEEDSSKQGRSLIEELDMDANFYLVHPHDAEIQEKISDDTEVLLAEEELIELVEDQGSGEKGQQEVTTADSALNTASVPFSTASATPEVSTAAESLVYIRRCAKKKKDKGKAIVIEDESVQKKSKKQVQEERLNYEETIRLQEQIDKEERKRIARDAEIAKQLQEKYDKVRKKEVVSEVDIAHVIDWDDPFVIWYHALQNRPRSVAEVRKNMMVNLKNQGGYKMKDFKGMRYDDIRPIFEKLWDQIHSFVPMDSEEEVQRLKRADEDPKTDELSQEQLNQMVIIVPYKGINVEALQTKYPIIRWEVHSNDTMQFWKIIKVGNHTEVYQVFEEMLKNFDRDDLIKLWSLVQERYNSSGLTEDKEIELWVELKMLFEPNAENLLELHKIYA
ncbi:putative ribonuclease H-like domain-containing protein [Tanacetum coccineum]